MEGLNLAAFKRVFEHIFPKFSWWFQKKYCHPETWGNDPNCRAYFFKWWLVQPPTTLAFKRNQTRDGLLKTDISPEN